MTNPNQDEYKTEQQVIDSKKDSQEENKIPENEHEQTIRQGCKQQSYNVMHAARYEGLNLIILGGMLIVTTIYAIFAGLQWQALREQTQSGMRAFVFVKDIQTFEVRDPKTQKVTSTEFGVRWENSGNTPARNMLMSVNFSYRKDPLPKNYKFPDFINKQEPYPIDLGPHSVRMSKPSPITIDKIRSVQNRSMHLYIYGWVKYQDVIKDTPWHITKFSNEVIVNNAGNIMFNMHGNHNDSN